MKTFARLVLSVTATALVSLALTPPPAEAEACRLAFFIAFDEQDCADTCHSRGCNYQYNPETSECACHNG